MDGRCGPQMMRESLKPLVWAIAESAKKLFKENLYYSNDEPVKVVRAIRSLRSYELHRSYGRFRQCRAAGPDAGNV